MPLEIDERDSVLLQVVTENIGAGGIGVLSDRPVYPNAILRCEFAVASSSLHIPTIMRVRWAEKVDGKREYRLGLEFLI